jgi:hypothetical protein
MVQNPRTGDLAAREGEFFKNYGFRCRFLRLSESSAFFFAPSTVLVICLVSQAAPVGSAEAGSARPERLDRARSAVAGRISFQNRFRIIDFFKAMTAL